MSNLTQTLATLAKRRAQLGALTAYLDPFKTEWKTEHGEAERRMTALRKQIKDLEGETRNLAVSLYRNDPTGPKALAGGAVEVIEKSDPVLDYDPAAATVWAKTDRPDLVSVTITVGLNNIEAVQQLIAALVMEGNVQINHDLNRAAYEALLLSKHRPAGMPGQVLPNYDARIAGDLAAFLPGDLLAESGDDLTGDGVPDELADLALAEYPSDEAEAAQARYEATLAVEVAESQAAPAA